MDTKDYQLAVLNTESTATSINFGTLSTHAVLGLIAKTATIVDAAKKATFYKGYQIDQEAFKQACVELMSCAGYLIEAIDSGDLTNPRDILGVDLPPEIANLDLGELNVRLLHVTYGINSESGELAEALTAGWEVGQEPDRVNFSEELGDVMWYLGVGSDAIKVPFPVLFQQNITKLNDKKNGRYRKGAFNVEEAITRNLADERQNLGASLSLDGKPFRLGPNAGEMSISQAEVIAGTVTKANITSESTTRADDLAHGVSGTLKSLANSAIDAVDNGLDKAKTFLNK